MTLAALRDRFARLPDPVQRLIAVVFVVALYYGMWRPMRTAYIQHWAYPVLEQAARDSPVSVEARGRVVQAFGSERATPLSPLNLKAPAGDKAFLGVVMFALLFPLRPYWMGLWGYNIVVGLIAFWGFRLGVGGADWGFGLAQFVQKTLGEAISLALPPLVYLLHRGGYIRLGRDPDSAAPVEASASSPT